MSLIQKYASGLWPMLPHPRTLPGDSGVGHGRLGTALLAGTGAGPGRAAQSAALSQDMSIPACLKINFDD